MPFDYVGACEKDKETMTTDERLDRIEQTLRAILATLSAGQTRPATTPTSGGSVDLDSDFGNFAIRKDPPRWKGQSYVGRRLSECPPEYLDMLADFCDWKAGKDEADGSPEKLKYAGYARKDAARARGWADRLRAGWRQPTLPGADSDVPF